MKHPSSMERPELIAEVAQLRERLARSAPVIEAAVALRVADRRADDALAEATTAELCDAVDALLIGTIAHATAVRIGVASTERVS